MDTMEEEERQRRASELRERKRAEYDGRIGTPDGDSEAAGGAGADTGGDRAAHDTEAGADVQNVRRPVVDFAPTGRDPETLARGHRGYQPGPRRLDRRSGPGSDRHREGDEQLVDDSAARFTGAGEGSGREASVGRLEAIGEVLRINKPEPNFSERQEERALPETRYRIDYYRSRRDGKPVYVHTGDKQIISPDEWKLLPERPPREPEPVFEPPKPEQPKEKLFGKSQVLSEAEIRELREPFTEALKDIGGYTDQGLWILNPAEKGNDIWGDLTDIEAGLLAKHLFKLGQKSPVVAVAIRETVHLKDYAALAAIVWPRVVKTKKLVDSAPPRPRRKRSLFRVVEGSAV